jgi:hypothetical protein
MDSFSEKFAFSNENYLRMRAKASKVFKHAWEELQADKGSPDLKNLVQNAIKEQKNDSENEWVKESSGVSEVAKNGDHFACAQYLLARAAKNVKKMHVGEGKAGKVEVGVNSEGEALDNELQVLEHRLA